jgi:hypothetical protein
MKRIIVSFFISGFVITSCSKSSNDGGGGNNTSSCDGVPKSFSANVNPIIQATCATSPGCHASGSLNGPGPLLTYTQIFDARISIKNAVNSGTMPKSGSLTSDQKKSIICWIDSGAPNN